MNDVSNIQRWIDNAEKGIREDKPNYVLTSSKRLKALGATETAERILREAF